MKLQFPSGCLVTFKNETFTFITLNFQHVFPDLKYFKIEIQYLLKIIRVFKICAKCRDLSLLQKLGSFGGVENIFVFINIHTGIL